MQGLVVERAASRVAPPQANGVGILGHPGVSDRLGASIVGRRTSRSPVDSPQMRALRGGGVGPAIGVTIMSKIFFTVLPLVLTLGTSWASDEHGREGHGHSHSHVHDHSHSHIHGQDAPMSLFDSGSTAVVWNYVSALTIRHPKTSAIGACALVSCSALFVLPFLPLLNQGGNMVSVHNSILLKLLISFAVGGLLGDVFLHMLPHMISHTLASPTQHDDVAQALSFGLPVLGGMLIFYLAEKIMAAFAEGSNTCSKHFHGHVPHVHEADTGRRGADAAVSKPVAAKGTNVRGAGMLDVAPQRTLSGFRQHQAEFDRTTLGMVCRQCQDLLGLTTGMLPRLHRHWTKQWPCRADKPEPSPPRQLHPGIKPAAYLNFLADLLHNFSDGLALGVAFGKGHGLSTTIAVFFHEVPHNVADFAILISNGFSQVAALQAQWASALGALLGTLAGLRLGKIKGMQGFIAGGFVYVATVDIIPLMLQDNSISTIFVETVAMMLGVALNCGMLYLEHSVPGACSH